MGVADHRGTLRIFEERRMQDFIYFKKMCLGERLRKNSSLPGAYAATRQSIIKENPACDSLAHLKLQAITASFDD